MNQLAQSVVNNPLLPDTVVDSTGQSYLSEILTNFLGLFLIGIFLFFFIYLIIGAIQWIMAGGDKGNVETARGRVTTAVIGIAIVFSVWAVIQLIEIFFGINILVINIDPLYLKNPDQGSYSVIENPLYDTDYTRSTTGSSFLTSFVAAAILLAMTLGAVIFFVMLLIGAVQWISSGGDKGALESARSRVTNAIIGLVIMFAIWAIVQLIGTFFGLELFTLNFNNYYLN